MVDANKLGQVLALYQEATKASLMPYTLTQYDTDNQVWTAYQGEQALLVITWISRYLAGGETVSGSRAALLPTADGAPFTLATGWMWALAGSQPDRQALGAQLAEFLSAGDFLAEWSLLIGYLPTRASSTAAWTHAELQSLAGQTARSAHPIPSTDVLSSLGGPLTQAVVQVLKQQSDPLTAAQEAADYLRNP
jgi:ABC-type glycerol-3-phosphate transport system substrate-binding protein